MKYKFTKNKIIAFIIIAIILVATFWYGGGAPGLQGFNISSNNKTKEPSTVLHNIEDLTVEDNKKPEEINIVKEDEKSQEQDVEEVEEVKNNDEKSNKENNSEENKPEEDPVDLQERPGGEEGGLTAIDKVELAKKLAVETSSVGVEVGSKDYSESKGMSINATTGKDKYLTDPVPKGKPIPVEPQNIKISDVEYTCTLSVRCDTILDNIKWLDSEKVELVPEDGVIYATKEVTFYEGESVFNVLHREMKQSKTHMEFSNTPMYNSVYIEGINNLYEFDCGELSGWMYKVNNWFPNYGCSRYQLLEGDVIEWIYTCNLGVDTGGFNAIGLQ